ncbi:uncharacterized protein (DUF305 family) [Psychrobacter sp. PL15]|uniref:CopM family metallochaperone n=1 Tax=Psychrobacter sp. PL15 TaxID=3071719 RepID=UPI002DFB0B6D|nr:uncharacterized protein (DUF305 family) [Psychrobacter sp. PL15]
MTTSYRFALLAASVTAALALSACQPAAEGTKATPIAEVMPPPIAVPESDADAMDPHAGHDMAAGDSMMDDSQMTDMHRDYTESMSNMHDEMMIGMTYNDPDTAFAKSMLGHHRGAVDMATIELKYGTDPTMRKLAQDIIDSQQVEIDIMRKWLASHPDAASPKPETQAMQQAYADGMDAMNNVMMLGIADPVADMAFARGMMPHHVSAVDMAKVQLKYGKDEEMRQLAQEIIDAQESEIELMQDWIATHKTDDNVIPDKTNAPEGVEANKTS